MQEIFWADKIADEIIKREQKLKRAEVFRTESGLGASGIPHIGSIGDVLRNYAVSLALKDAGCSSELIAFSDDRDGLRKVPLGFPDWLEKFLGTPVTDIKDPFECHKSYGEHISSLLIDALEKLGIEYKFQSATKAYKSGALNEQIEKILLSAEKIKKIVKDTLGQELTTVYFPVCEQCGKIYTTRVTEVSPKTHKVTYKCDVQFKGKNMNSQKEIVIDGCGFEGETSYWSSNGKLAWKGEFAARWCSLGIVFEAAGKDIVDSVNVNDIIADKILSYSPPLHLIYEMFLEKGGKKISKSVGGVFSPQDWLRYGSPESLRLLMFKRFLGTRELSPRDIPVYMDEVDRLEKVYFGEEKIKNEKRLVHLKRLFEYIHFLKPPKETSLKVPYLVLINIVKVLPIENKFEIVKEILTSSGHIKKLTVSSEKALRQRLTYADGWAGIEAKERPQKILISAFEKGSLNDLADSLKEELSAEQIQTKIFEIARKHKIKVQRAFKIFYQIILGIDKGPRAGHLIKIIGQENVIKMIKKALEQA